jgi:predicted metal-dependent hydrolase
MDDVIIFGKKYKLIEEKSDKEGVELKGGKVVVKSCETPPNLLLREFLSDELSSELLDIYGKIKKSGRLEVFGDLKFEVVEKIDGKRQRIAKLKDNKILVKMSAVRLPKEVLRYVVAHELAHIFTKRHTKKFWKAVEMMCPNFERARGLLAKYG